MPISDFKSSQIKTCTGKVVRIREGIKVARMLRVQDIMTKEVFVLNASDTLDLVRSLMEIEHIRHVPIVDEQGNFVGLLTHRDLLSLTVSRLSCIDRNEQDNLDRNIPIDKVMQTDVVTIHPDTDLVTALEILVKNKYGCLPVVADKKLVGIVTEADFLSLTYSLLSQ